jgi:hypothetical protein
MSTAGNRGIERAARWRSGRARDLDRGISQRALGAAVRAVVKQRFVRGRGRSPLFPAPAAKVSWRTSSSKMCGRCSAVPPRRFAPPLLVEEGKPPRLLAQAPLLVEEGRGFVLLPSFTRRGGREADGVVAARARPTNSIRPSALRGLLQRAVVTARLWTLGAKRAQPQGTQGSQGKPATDHRFDSVCSPCHSRQRKLLRIQLRRPRATPVAAAGSRRDSSFL